MHVRVLRRDTLYECMHVCVYARACMHICSPGWPQFALMFKSAEKPQDWKYTDSQGREFEINFVAGKKSGWKCQCAVHELCTSKIKLMSEGEHDLVDRVLTEHTSSQNVPRIMLPAY